MGEHIYFIWDVLFMHIIGLVDYSNKNGMVGLDSEI